jgi:8-oxo-dGTP pyrophosphatase MutT (NUDIX family)
MTNEGPVAARIPEDDVNSTQRVPVPSEPTLSNLTKVDIKTLDPRAKTTLQIQNLLQFKSDFVDPFTGDSPRASVLIALKIEDGELHVLLTKRSGHLKSHSGEVAFPGGKRDETDLNNFDTALREAQEEVGLFPDSVTYLTTLPITISKNRLIITPIIVLVPNFEPVQNPDEVEACFWVPLETFLKSDIHQHQDIVWGAGPHRMHSFLFPAARSIMNIFGLTAGLCITTAQIAFARDPEYSRHAPEEIKRDYSRFRDLVKEPKFKLLPNASIPHSHL